MKMQAHIDLLKPNSGTCHILDFLKGVKRGSVLLVDDFKIDPSLTYTNIRSILAYLCRAGILIRLGFGIYCYPKYDKNRRPIFPSVYSVITRIAKRDGYDFCPFGEYAEFLMELRDEIPKTVLCYNNQKSKSFKLENGISVIIRPGYKYFKPHIKSIQLRTLVAYIRSKHIDAITLTDRIALINFFNGINSVDLESDLDMLPLEIKEFLEID